jgi:hypothetical protein
MTTPAAGWYHDPSDSDAWRWWDGVTWTAHVRPKEQTAPVAVVAEPAAVSAPQPVQHPQPATLTPATPASEQLYWHSAEAEVIHIPGRSATTHSSQPRNGGTPARAIHIWGEVGSPQTAGIWLLAFLPIMASLLSSAAGFVFQSIAGSEGATLDPAGTAQKGFAVLIAYAAVLVIAAWIFAGRDIKTLRARGYSPPTIWWMLVPLSPLAYFIARGKVVRAEGKRAWPPELLFFLSIIIPIALTVIGMIFAMSLLATLAGTAGIPV